jgi:hypothetical protein
VQPTFPAVFISSSQNAKQFLLACGDEPTVQLVHYFTRPLRGTLLVDSTGQAYQVTRTSISGIRWPWIFMSGPVIGLIALILQLLTLTVPVRVSVSYAPASPMELKEFKSVVLSRISASASNFMGGGDATAWRAPVNTAASFSQVIGRLCLRA